MANGGLTSTTIRDLFSPSALFGSAGGWCSSFSARRLDRSRLRNALGFQEEACLTHQNPARGGSGSVQCAVCVPDGEKVAIRTNQLVALRRAVDFTQELLKYSSATYTDALTSQQSLFSAELNSTNDRLQQL